ncbi:MAG: transposase [Candidatus Aminicenantes bacterium]
MAQGQAPASAGTSLEFIARMTSHIPDKGQVMVRYYGLYYANAHREPAPAKAGER